MAEIDDNELASLRGAKQLLDQLLASPKTGRTVHKQIKEIHPSYMVPVDPEETTKAAAEAAKNVLDEHIKKQANDKLETDFRAKIDPYRLSESNPNGLTDEGIEKVINLMRDRNIPDFDAGVLLFEKLNPAKPEPPSGYVPTGWNFGAKGDDDKKLLFEDPDAWADKEARKVWEEHRKSGTFGG